MFDDWQSVAWFVGAILIAYGVVLWLGTIVWTYRDISERTRDGWSQAVSVLLVMFFNMPGLFLYLILRPHETLAEAYERRLEAEALMRDMPEQRSSCPRCERPADGDFFLCPYCRTNLREPCSACGRALDLGWAACPYCGAQGPQTVTAANSVRAAEPPAPAAEQPRPTPGEPAPRVAEAGTPQAEASGRSSPFRP